MGEKDVFSGKSAFAGCHPFVIFLCFGLVLLFAMFCMEPFCLGAAFCSAALYSLSLSGAKGLFSRLKFLLPMALFAGLLNPLLNHRGDTVLFTSPWGPVTAESLAFGGMTGLLLGAALLWFSCWNAVMSPDKFLSLFSRLSPALALVLSQALGLVPRFCVRLREVREAQRALSGGKAPGSPVQKARQAVSSLSVLISCVLEDAVETAASMKSRGYGLPGRTSYTPYRLSFRDSILFCWLCLSGAYLIFGRAAGGFFWRCYPRIEAAPLNGFTLSLRGVYLLLCLTPLLLDCSEAVRWAAARREIEKGGEGR